MSPRRVTHPNHPSESPQSSVEEAVNVDVRIGITQSVREIELDIADEQHDALRAQVDQALASGEGVLWLTDRKGRDVGVPAAKIAYVEIGSTSEERRVGFAL
jgi:hypothetical protein